jgi:hypothetical protein
MSLCCMSSHSVSVASHPVGVRSRIRVFTSGGSVVEMVALCRGESCLCTCRRGGDVHVEEGGGHVEGGGGTGAARLWHATVW